MKYLNRTSQNREKHHYFTQQQGDNRKQHNPNHHHHSISLNDVFRSLLALTQLDKDIPTLIKLFEEQGLEICETRVRTWSTPVHINNRPIPHIIFVGFMKLLERINAEASRVFGEVFKLLHFTLLWHAKIICMCVQSMNSAYCTNHSLCT